MIDQLQERAIDNPWLEETVNYLRKLMQNRDRRVIPTGVVELQGFAVKFEVIIRTGSLMIGAYSDYQKTLSDSIIQMRDDEKMTFKGISEALTKKGYRSPRGFDLSPESVFSIYKKRKIRDVRLKTQPKQTIANLRIVG